MRLNAYESKSLLVVVILLWIAQSIGAQSRRTDETTRQQTNEKKENADQQESDTSTDEESANEDTTMFPHSQASRFWISGQINFIAQGHGSFPARYSGDNSLRPTRERATSDVLTLYTGVQVTKWTELLIDIESAGGRGISDALGLAGFTNLDVVRNPTLGSKPYLARAMIHQIIPLGREKSEATRGAFSLATELPIRRLEIRAGKFSLADFFDTNSIGSDSHLQFMNWTIDNNGGYDYAADTRGYTYGAIIEYQTPQYGIRYGLAQMPKVANGINLDAKISRARGENLEFEFRRSLIPFVTSRPGVLRLLSYANHANMGSYREAINSYLAGREKVPDIEAHRKQGRVKYGFGVNFEQELSKTIRVFGRFGWNEGKNESFAYTEVNQTVSFGSDVRGDRWRRKLDKIGAAFVANAISGDHRRYLQLGGKGFLLGDGTLNYNREYIFETYYTAHIYRGLFASFDIQRIANPGYNRDRGPALVPAGRLHMDF